MPIYEVLISNGSFGSSVEEGDIVDVRPPRGEIGRKEARLMTLVQMDLTESQVELYRSGTRYGDMEKGQPKFRWNIPLANLTGINPALDLVKARDLSVDHQPFVVEHEDGRVSFTTPAFSQGNLVVDKVPPNITARMGAAISAMAGSASSWINTVVVAVGLDRVGKYISRWMS